MAARRLAGTRESRRTRPGGHDCRRDALRQGRVPVTATASPTLAATHRVSRMFGDVTAVDQASLEVRGGEIVGLLGANGAGKTTLIRMLLGRTPSRSSRRRIGYVSQSLGLYADLTVEENVQFAATAFAVKPADITLHDSLSEVRHQLVGDIGLGRQHQLAFACACGHQPDLLVLDEPTSGVDTLARARLWDTIHDQAERGVGLLVTTHYMQEAQQCDRLVIMAAGRVVATGHIDAIVGDATAVEVRSDAWARAFTALNGAGVPVTLAGRRVRVADVSPDAVRRTLTGAGVTAEVEEVPATLEEIMLVISRGHDRDPD